MRIGVDARPLARVKTGIGHYLSNILTQLAKIDDKNEYYLYSHLPITEKLPAFFRHIRSAQTSKSLFWMQSQLPIWLVQDKIDVYWGGDYAAPLIGAMPRSWKTVITVHDLVSRRYPQTLPWKLQTHLRWVLPMYLRIADQIIADSQNTAKDIAGFYGYTKNVKVVPLAASQRFFSTVANDELQAVLTRYDLQPGYLLYVGTVEPRKGVDTILRALALLKERRAKFPPMVFVGRIGWKTGEIMRLPEKLGLQDDVLFLEYVADADLPSLYQGAQLFLYPSLYEGFGLPVLEAMASGTPVITSRASSLPEVAGDAAIYIDAGDVEGLATEIAACINNADRRQALRQSGYVQANKFSWRSTAKQTLRVFEEIGRCKG